MDVFEIIRIVPEGERPVVKPTPPKPQSATVGFGTEEEWNEYWIQRDSFYHGLELRKI